MAASNPPINGAQYIVYIALQDMANPGSYLANPPLASGDVKISIDGGALANIDTGGTLPAVTPANSIWVKVTVSGTQMTGDNIAIQFIDQTNPKAWADYAFNIQTTLANAAANIVQVDGVALGTHASGQVPADARDILGTAISTPATAGILDVNVKNIDNDAASASGTVTFPNATLASTGNITAGTITTVTNLTNNNDKTGYALSSGGVQAIWDALTSAFVTVGSIGKLLADDINATITSRLASGSYTSPPSAATIAAAVWDYLTSAATTVGSLGKLLVDDINATISSRSSHSAADVWAVATRLLTAGTNIVLAKGVGVTGFNDPSAADNADAVWDEAIAGHLGAGSTGASLNAAGSAGDPWATALPGAYGAGTAGKIVGDNLNAPVGDVPTAVENADALLARNLAGGANGGRTVQDALRLLRNKRSIAAGTLTVTEEDDATPAWTATIATAASDPTSSVDPA